MVIFKFKEDDEVIDFKNFEATLDDWLIGQLIKEQIKLDKNTIDIEIEIKTDRKSAMSVIYSMIYCELIMLEGSDISLIKHISKEWAVPIWLSIEIEAKIKEDEPVYICLICRVGFKKSENLKGVCKSHKGKFDKITKKFDCCGRIFEEFCIQGYHKAPY